MKRNLFITLALICLASLANALQIKVQTNPEQREENYKDYSVLIEPGKPMLHYYKLNVLLPYGEVYTSASLNWGKTRNLSKGFSVDFAKDQVPISQGRAYSQTVADPEVYEQNMFFPQKDFEYLGTQYYRGYAIAMFNVFPLRYNPITKELVAYESFELKINTDDSAKTAQMQAQYVSEHNSSLRILETLVKNPQIAASYANAPKSRYQSRFIDPADATSMIIITSSSRTAWFEEYAAWRTEKGIATAIYSTDFIYSNYTGADNAEKVRNFIIDAYLSWIDAENPLEYVIMGGDDEVVPERGVFGRVGSTVDNRMPSDLYFGALDGNWNANGNAIYGEAQDETDLIAELDIGRFPAETQTEFNNIFRKIRYYVEHNSYSNNKAIFYGENLNNDPLTWGGDYKDDVAQYLPGEYDFSTQYQRDGTYSSTTVWNSINDGVNVMNHMGHANETSLMGQGSGSIIQLQNTEYGFLYSQGCYPAAFDQRTSGDSESVAEQFVKEAGGLFSFVGNTRYGWYMPGGINGASQFYDRDYFLGLYQTGFSKFGEALSFSRLQNLSNAITNDVMRWCYMEIILFGDPSVEVKFPNLDIPMLEMVSYEFEDTGLDGTINPGDTIRLVPTIHNVEGWGTAYDVTLKIEAIPEGLDQTLEWIYINYLLPGEFSSDNIGININLPQDLSFGEYNLRLSLESIDPVTNLSTGIKYYDASFEITLFDDRFPWQTYHGGKSAPIVTDINQDGNNEILYVDVLGNVHIVDNNGEETGVLSPPEPLNVFSSSALGQIDNVAGEDIVTTSRTGKVLAMDLNGDVIFNYNANTQVLFSPVIADINGDGNNEVICTGIDGSLHVINNQGYSIAGFPIQLSSMVRTELAVGKLANVGPMQIVMGTSAGDVVVVGPDGLVNELYSHNLGASVTISPVILDNGKFALGTNSDLYLVDSSGIVFQKNIDNAISGGMIIADLNRDGSLDLVGVSTSGTLWAVTQSSADIPGFPVEIGTAFNCPPLVADIDGDLQYEIILHNNMNSVYIYNHDGSSMIGYPFVTSFLSATPATLVDYDSNGYYGLVAGYSNGILYSNLRCPESSLEPWTTYRGSLNRQASFAATGYVDNEDAIYAPVIDRLKQNYPNPFNPNTTIAFELARAQNVSLDVFNVKGQKVRNLRSGFMAAGNHTIAWDATDDFGKALASGLYFYRLQSNQSTFTRKMLLMK